MGAFAAGKRGMSVGSPEANRMAAVAIQELTGVLEGPYGAAERSCALQALLWTQVSSHEWQAHMLPRCSQKYRGWPVAKPSSGLGSTPSDGKPDGLHACKGAPWVPCGTSQLSCALQAC